VCFENTDSLSTNSLSDKQTRKKTNSCPNMQKKPKVITYYVLIVRFSVHYYFSFKLRDEFNIA